MSVDRRAFLLGIGATATCLSMPAAAAAAAGAATTRVDLSTLLSIIGSPTGGATWVQSIAHVLEMAPRHPPRVLFAEIAVVECRIRTATAAEIARAGAAGLQAFHVSAVGVARALEAGTHRRLERFTHPATGRTSAVKPRRWESRTLITDDAWISLDDAAPIKRLRTPAQVAVGGDEWYVFHSAASDGLDAGTSGSAVESTGWRVRPTELAQPRVSAGYNHVCLSSVGLRPWLGYEDNSPVQLLENATGRKVFDRRELAPELAALLG
jgi:hypothetical protein